MKNAFRTMTFCSLTLAVTLLATGCGPKSDDKSSSDGKTGKTDPHPTEGLNGGDLIELGNDHKYHGEFKHDEKAGTMTIYILDGTAKKTVPIKAKTIVINLKHEGEPKTYTFTAKSDEGDPEGQSSRFVLTDKDLVEDLEHDLGHDDADAELMVKISGTDYPGKVKHDHKHEDEKTHAPH